MTLSVIAVGAACILNLPEPAAQPTDGQNVAGPAPRVTATPVTATSVLPPSAPATAPVEPAHARAAAPTPPAQPAMPGALQLAASTADGFTVAWQQPAGDAPADHFRLHVNGAPAGETTAQSATLAWPAGDGPVLVQVFAVAADGTASTERAFVIVRAAAQPAPAAEAADPASEDPAVQGEPGGASASPSVAPSVAAPYVAPADPATTAAAAPCATSTAAKTKNPKATKTAAGCVGATTAPKP